MKIFEIFNLLRYVFNFSRRLLVFSLITWIISISLGLCTGFIYDSLPEETQQRLNILLGLPSRNPVIIETVKTINIGNYLVSMFLIFLNNTVVLFLIMIYSFTIVLVFWFVYFNGYIYGLMYGLVASTGTFFSPIQTLGLIIFWTLEVVAYSIIMAFSFRLLFSFLFPKRIYKKDIRRIQSVKLTLKGFKKIFLVAVLFLLIGAIVETIVVISIKTSGILYKNIFEECGITFQGIIPNSPAERSGLKPFTRIVKINNESVYNLTNFLEVLKKYKPEELIIFESGTGQKFYVKLEPPIESNKTVFIGLENVYTAFVKKGRCL